MESLIMWIETQSKNLTSLTISKTCANAGRDRGRDYGMKLSRALTVASQSTLRELILEHTDFIGSRNIKEWEESLQKMTSLKKFKCSGLTARIKNIKESNVDEHSMVVHRAGDIRSRKFIGITERFLMPQCQWKMQRDSNKLQLQQKLVFEECIDTKYKQ